MQSSDFAGKRFIMPRPNSAPQEEFFLSEGRFVAYGGARGGGKSWALRNKAVLLAFNYAGIRILLLRRTFGELEENHIRPMRAQLHSFASYRERDHRFTFVNNSSIKFGYCDREADVLQYQGHEYDVIMLDEATHFTEFQYKTLTACLRGVNDFPKRFYLSGNPGGVGHGWFKRLFISRKYEGSENGDDYVFIPAKVYDNKDLMEKDPNYVSLLENLPPDLKRAWLDGDWDVFVGQYFSEWRRDVHVVEPFLVPAHWRKYFTMDYGLDMLAGYWVAMDEDGRAFVYRELYEGKENYKGENGGGLLMSEAAQRIKNLTPAGEKIEAWFAPPDLWNRRQDTGRNVADVFAAHGIYLTSAKNERVQGWLEVKEWLRCVPQASGQEAPKLQVFKTCVNLIDSMPNLVHDEKNPSDCAREPHKYTHAPDAIRYFVAGRPFAGKLKTEGDGCSEKGGGGYASQMNDLLNFGV